MFSLDEHLSDEIIIDTKNNRVTLGGLDIRNVKYMCIEFKDGKWNCSIQNKNVDNNIDYDYISEEVGKRIQEALCKAARNSI